MTSYFGITKCQRTHQSSRACTAALNVYPHVTENYLKTKVASGIFTDVESGHRRLSEVAKLRSRAFTLPLLDLARIGRALCRWKGSQNNTVQTRKNPQPQSELQLRELYYRICTPRRSCLLTICPWFLGLYRDGPSSRADCGFF